MQERPSDLSSNRSEYFCLITAIVVSLAILFNNDAPQVETIRAGMVTAYAAVQKNLNWTNRNLITDQQVSTLRLRATELMLENSQLREALLENHRLRQMLDYKQRSHLPVKAARVLFKEMTNTPNAVIIDLGERDSMKVNMPVVTPAGLAGKIYAVNTLSSHVQLMLDPNFSVSARTQRGRVLGIVSWTAAGGLEMTGVTREADIRHEDVVITSEHSALFPPGIKIGLVDEVRIDETTFFGSISLKSEVPFSQLEEVFVILTQPELNLSVSRAPAKSGVEQR